MLRAAFAVVLGGIIFLAGCRTTDGVFVYGHEGNRPAAGVGTGWEKPPIDAPWERQPFPKDEVFVTGVGYHYDVSQDGDEGIARQHALADALEKLAKMGYAGSKLREVASAVQYNGNRETVGVKVLYKADKSE
jgi:hypothetical protein